MVTQATEPNDRRLFAVAFVVIGADEKKTLLTSNVTRYMLATGGLTFVRHQVTVASQTCYG